MKGVNFFGGFLCYPVWESVSNGLKYIRVPASKLIGSQEDFVIGSFVTVDKKSKFRLSLNDDYHYGHISGWVCGKEKNKTIIMLSGCMVFDESLNPASYAKVYG